jgi:hypothetical protein
MTSDPCPYCGTTEFYPDGSHLCGTEKRHRGWAAALLIYPAVLLVLFFWALLTVALR